MIRKPLSRNASCRIGGTAYIVGRESTVMVVDRCGEHELRAPPYPSLGGSAFKPPRPSPPPPIRGPQPRPQANIRSPTLTEVGGHSAAAAKVRLHPFHPVSEGREFSAPLSCQARQHPLPSSRRISVTGRIRVHPRLPDRLDRHPRGFGDLRVGDAAGDPIRSRFEVHGCRCWS